MKPDYAFFLVAFVLFTTSCVSRKKYLDSQIQLRYLKNDSTQFAYRIDTLTNKISDLENQVADLSEKNAALTASANSTESELNKSRQSLLEEQKKLQQVQNLLDQQKQQTEALRKKMTEALVGFNDSDLTVTQKNGKVYVSLSEHLLFPSGSAVVNPQGKDALAKLATVLNANPDISVNIEGHTDSIPIHLKYPDNWALSTARATSIVRILVNDYHVDPVRVIASGHSQFDPVDTNSSEEGRARNRRTEIILSPNLEELYRLLGQ